MNFCPRCGCRDKNNRCARCCRDDFTRTASMEIVSQFEHIDPPETPPGFTLHHFTRHPFQKIRWLFWRTWLWKHVYTYVPANDLIKTVMLHEPPRMAHFTSITA